MHQTKVSMIQLHNDVDMNLSIEVDILANVRAEISKEPSLLHRLLLNQTKIVCPSFKGPVKSVKMSAEFYKYAPDKTKKEKQVE